MPLLSVSQLAVAYGAETIFSGLDLRLERRARLAVVGANGAGKSSLLHVLAGDLEPSEGSIDRLRGLRSAHLPQDAPVPVANTVLEEVMASRTDLAAMRHELSTLESAMSRAEPGLEGQLSRYGDLQHATRMPGATSWRRGPGRRWAVWGSTRSCGAATRPSSRVASSGASSWPSCWSPTPICS